MVGCGKNDPPSKTDASLSPTASDPQIAKSLANIQQLGLALAIYMDQVDSLPDGPISWRVQILPNIELQNIDPNNPKTPMPGLFLDPRWQKKEDAPKETYYQVFRGASETEAAAISGTLDKMVGGGDMRKGNSMPLVLVEASTPVPWTSADGIDIAKPLPKLGGPKHEDFLGVFVDVSGKIAKAKVALFPANTSEKDLRMLINYRKKPEKTVDYKIMAEASFSPKK
jgi:hypothetical protein